MILSNKHRKKLVLIDGSSYLYRAFYALPNLKNSSGKNTGAIHGVINMLNKLMKTHNPDHIVVIFDAKGKNFRHEIYKDYKGTRKAMPEELVEQVQPIINFIESLGIKVIQIKGVEADDVIATLAKKFSNQNEKVIISSGDKDLAQLVDQNIELVNSFDNKLLDKKAIKEKFGVLPEKIFDYVSKRISSFRQPFNYIPALIFLKQIPTLIHLLGCYIPEQKSLQTFDFQNLLSGFQF